MFEEEMQVFLWQEIIFEALENYFEKYCMLHNYIDLKNL